MPTIDFPRILEEIRARLAPLWYSAGIERGHEGHPGAPGPAGPGYDDPRGPWCPTRSNLEEIISTVTEVRDRLYPLQGLLGIDPQQEMENLQEEMRVMAAINEPTFRSISDANLRNHLIELLSEGLPAGSISAITGGVIQGSPSNLLYDDIQDTVPEFFPLGNQTTVAAVLGDSSAQDMLDREQEFVGTTRSIGQPCPCPCATGICRLAHATGITCPDDSCDLADDVRDMPKSVWDDMPAQLLPENVVLPTDPEAVGMWRAEAEFSQLLTGHPLLECPECKTTPMIAHNPSNVCPWSTGCHHFPVSAATREILIESWNAGITRFANRRLLRLPYGLTADEATAILNQQSAPE